MPSPSPSHTAQQSVQPTDDDSIYEIRDDVMIRVDDGATVSAIVIRQKGIAARQPAVFTLDIYTNPESAKRAGKAWAARGYVSVLADVRGKRLSPDKVVLYERDGEDAYAVIDWISRQPWSNGKVGVVGGSFSGFTAWAATKRMHPALKTIAVSAAQNPGLGLPLMNNIFLTPNYGWVQYTTNNKYLDDATYNDTDRWQNLTRNWFASGRPYREIDQVDGTPNPWLQRWLQHPEYDAYWQGMVPYKQEFAKINIPVLTITGYYDDGQISALDYMKQHTTYNRKAEHYLVIGPRSLRDPAQARTSPMNPSPTRANRSGSSGTTTVTWMFRATRIATWKFVRDFAVSLALRKRRDPRLYGQRRGGCSRSKRVVEVEPPPLPPLLARRGNRSPPFSERTSNSGHCP